MWPFKHYDCKRCKDKRVIKFEQRIPYNELSPRDKAEIWVNGGYAYNLVEKPCPDCT